mmetsp:Transcript_1308/g.3001  ORF Transcript_1308/g.3001 Transcript_1308/m.3001 type:complete len:243 (-) Transcript_1308:3-731(-)
MQNHRFALIEGPFVDQNPVLAQTFNDKKSFGRKAVLVVCFWKRLGPLFLYHRFGVLINSRLFVLVPHNTSSLLVSVIDGHVSPRKYFFRPQAEKEGILLIGFVGSTQDCGKPCNVDRHAFFAVHIKAVQKRKGFLWALPAEGHIINSNGGSCRWRILGLGIALVGWRLIRVGGRLRGGTFGTFVVCNICHREVFLRIGADLLLRIQLSNFFFCPISAIFCFRKNAERLVLVIINVKMIFSSR